MFDITAIWQRYAKSALVLGLVMLSIYAVVATFRVNNLSRDNSDLQRQNQEYGEAVKVQQKLAVVTDITMLARERFGVEAQLKVESDINEITRLQSNAPCVDAPVIHDVLELVRKAVAAANHSQ